MPRTTIIALLSFGLANGFFLMALTKLVRQPGWPPVRTTEAFHRLMCAGFATAIVAFLLLREYAQAALDLGFLIYSVARLSRAEPAADA